MAEFILCGERTVPSAQCLEALPADPHTVCLPADVPSQQATKASRTNSSQLETAGQKVLDQHHRAQSGLETRWQQVSRIKQSKSY